MKFIGIVALLILSIILTAYTVSTLWLWFIVPLGAPTIGMAHAYGAALLLQYLTVRVSDKEEDVGATVVLQILKSLGALLVGLVTLQFM